jgi:predicted glycogen debranching enzyme
VDDDGLLAAGAEGVQLTWMDARVGGREVTPRPGKPVEVQALWYNALCPMEELARAFGDEVRQKQYDEMAESNFRCELALFEAVTRPGKARRRRG